MIDLQVRAVKVVSSRASSLRNQYDSGRSRNGSDNQTTGVGRVGPDQPCLSSFIFRPKRWCDYIALWQLSCEDIVDVQSFLKLISEPLMSGW